MVWRKEVSDNASVDAMGGCLPGMKRLMASNPSIVVLVLVDEVLVVGSVPSRAFFFGMLFLFLSFSFSLSHSLSHSPRQRKQRGRQKRINSSDKPRVHDHNRRSVLVVEREVKKSGAQQLRSPILPSHPLTQQHNEGPSSPPPPTKRNTKARGAQDVSPRPPDMHVKPHARAPPISDATPPHPVPTHTPHTPPPEPSTHRALPLQTHRPLHLVLQFAG